jgi:hypothetical protein
MRLTPAHEAALKELVKGTTSTFEIGKVIRSALGKKGHRLHQTTQYGNRILDSLHQIGMVAFSLPKGRYPYVWKITKRGREYLAETGSAPGVASTGS